MTSSVRLVLAGIVGRIHSLGERESRYGYILEIICDQWVRISRSMELRSSTDVVRWEVGHVDEGLSPSLYYQLLVSSSSALIRWTRGCLAGYPGGKAAADALASRETRLQTPLNRPRSFDMLLTRVLTGATSGSWIVKAFLLINLFLLSITATSLGTKGIVRRSHLPDPPFPPSAPGSLFNLVDPEPAKFPAPARTRRRGGPPVRGDDSLMQGPRMADPGPRPHAEMQDSAAFLFILRPAADRQVRYDMANLAPLSFWLFSFFFLAFPGPSRHAPAYYLTGWFGLLTQPLCR